ncbi:DUF6875 domain-containing protein [Trinickia sp. EG282A]|uniref:DUF6875 domain-containing protein n=1 Tax=Trinickia sp. EG282A TaxID=3237013 RepID=UPI0034D2F796
MTIEMMNIARNSDPAQASIEAALVEIERSLYLSTAIHSIPDANVAATFSAGLEWMKRFVMRPHPHLGRRGAVCPFARPVHEEPALYFCTFDCGGMNFETFVEIMLQVPKLYRRIAAGFSGRSDLLSLCVFPRGLSAASYYKFIDCAHSILKPIYMSAGLMIGEFHPLSAVHGAHSDKIFPLRADVPFFAIRSTTAHDILFIDRESGSAGQRIHELECYLDSAGELLPDDKIERIRARIEQLKSQLVSEQDPADTVASR